MKYPPAVLVVTASLLCLTVRSAPIGDDLDLASVAANAKDTAGLSLDEGVDTADGDVMSVADDVTAAAEQQSADVTSDLTADITDNADTSVPDTNVVDEADVAAAVDDVENYVDDIENSDLVDTDSIDSAVDVGMADESGATDQASEDMMNADSMDTTTGSDQAVDEDMMNADVMDTSSGTDQTGQDTANSDPPVDQGTDSTETDSNNSEQGIVAGADEETVDAAQNTDGTTYYQDGAVQPADSSDGDASAAPSADTSSNPNGDVSTQDQQAAVDNGQATDATDPTMTDPSTNLFYGDDTTGGGMASELNSRDAGNITDTTGDDAVGADEFTGEDDIDEYLDEFNGLLDNYLSTAVISIPPITDFTGDYKPTAVVVIPPITDFTEPTMIDADAIEVPTGLSPSSLADILDGAVPMGTDGSTLSMVSANLTEPTPIVEVVPSSTDLIAATPTADGADAQQFHADTGGEVALANDPSAMSADAGTAVPQPPGADQSSPGVLGAVVATVTVLGLITMMVLALFSVNGRQMRSIRGIGSRTRSTATAANPPLPGDQSAVQGPYMELPNEEIEMSEQQWIA